MAKKLFEKAGLIQMPMAVPKEPQQPAAAEEPRAKTAPGSMLHFMTAQSTAIKEAESLREELSRFDGATPVRALDPRTVRPSVWANRHAASPETPRVSDSVWLHVQGRGLRASPRRGPPANRRTDASRYPVPTDRTAAAR